MNQLKIYSLERRRDRYRIIYTWCILEDIVPNFNYNDEAGGIHSYTNQRLGRKCNLKAVNVKQKNIWRDCLSQEGPKLFNALPKFIRNLTSCTKETFKHHLDQFLNTLPDEPLLPNYLNFRRADSNSVSVMVNHRIQRIG
ncbi:MAG: hypothetical protein AAF193_12050 [Bacteroidota bacterium]